jgi:hypothetical protein
MDKVQEKNIVSVCYTPSSKPYSVELDTIKKLYLYKKPKMKITLMINLLNNRTEYLIPSYTTIPHDTRCTSEILVRFLHPSCNPTSTTLATNHSIYVVGLNSHSNTTCSKIPTNTSGSELYKLIKHKKCKLKIILHETFATDKYKNVLIAIHMSVMLIIVVLFLFYSL